MPCLLCSAWVTHPRWVYLGECYPLRGLPCGLCGEEWTLSPHLRCVGLSYPLWPLRFRRVPCISEDSRGGRWACLCPSCDASLAQRRAEIAAISASLQVGSEHGSQEGDVASLVDT